MIYFSPYSPAQVDFHSTLKYLTRLPEMLERLEEEGVEPRLSASIGFMSKMTNKRDHETSHSPPVKCMRVIFLTHRFRDWTGSNDVVNL